MDGMATMEVMVTFVAEVAVGAQVDRYISTLILQVQLEPT